jgi:anti-sigma factor RsiW
MDARKKQCEEMNSKLAELLLDEEAAPAKLRAHVAECEACRREMDELRATMALLDAWEAPEPSPYFMTQLETRFREEKAAASAGWLARLRAWLIYGGETHLRPLAAMALTVMMLVGGGTYMGITDWDGPAPAPQTAVVHDLQTMDSNAQVLDQLETLSSGNKDGD